MATLLVSFVNETVWPVVDTIVTFMSAGMRIEPTDKSVDRIMEPTPISRITSPEKSVDE